MVFSRAVLLFQAAHRAQFYLPTSFSSLQTTEHLQLHSKISKHELNIERYLTHSCTFSVAPL